MIKKFIWPARAEEVLRCFRVMKALSRSRILQRIREKQYRVAKMVREIERDISDYKQRGYAR